MMLHAINLLKAEIESIGYDFQLIKKNQEVKEILEEKRKQIRLAITCLELVEKGLDPFENGAFIWEGYKKIESDE